MSKKSMSVFSLSLLDMLFCAFGGVIVLTVVFSAIVKYEQASSIKSREVALDLKLNFSTPDGFPSWRMVLLREENDPLSYIENQRDERSVFNSDSTLVVLSSTLKDGQLSIGLRGILSKKDDFIQEKLYLKFETFSGGQEGYIPLKWSNAQGRAHISSTIYRPGEIPVETSKDFNLVSGFLDDVDKSSIPIMLTLREVNSEIDFSIDYLD